MKILLCGPYPYKNENIWGGVESVIYNLKLGFKKYSHKDDISIMSGNAEAQGKYELYKDTLYINIPKLRLGSVSISSYPFRVKKYLKRESFNILSSHSIDLAYYGLVIKNKMIEWE